MSKGRRTGITMNKKLGSTLIAMTIIIFMLFLTLGMFTKTFSGSASAEIASAQASIVDGTLSNSNIDAEDSGSYTFSVKNTDKDGNKVSEVALKYTLNIETQGYDASKVDYKLYRINDNNTETEVTNKITDDDNVEWYTAENMTFDVESNPQVHKYRVEFRPQDDGTLNFKVKIKAEQVD